MASVAYQEKRGRRLVTVYRCDACDATYEYRPKYHGHQHYCPTDARIRKALRTRHLMALKWAQAEIEKDMRYYVKLATGSRKQLLRKGDPDPNLLTLRDDHIGEAIRRLGRLYYAVLRASWGLPVAPDLLAEPVETDEAA